MDRWSRIISVAAVGDTHLRARFDNGVTKMYDCRPVVARPEFRLLAVPAFFRAVRVDTGGCGVSWNDEMDLSEYELWVNGEAVPSE